MDNTKIEIRTQVKEVITVLAKNKKIIESYFEFWEQLPDDAHQQALYNNGYIHSKYLEFSNGSLLDCIEFERMDTYDAEFGEPIQVFRPKSLQGIEDNNGWNIITDDLEFTAETFWLYNSSNRDLFRGRLFDDDKLPIHRYATHYQPIEIPIPPIY